MCIKLRVVAAELLFCPTGERRRFIVQEDAAILYARLRLNVSARSNIELIFVRDRNICPPRPRRDANLFGQIIDAEDSTALVGSSDNESTPDAWHRICNDLSNGHLPVPANRGDIKFVLSDQAVNDNATPNSADQHNVSIFSPRAVDDLGSSTSYLRDVRRKAADCA